MRSDAGWSVYEQALGARFAELSPGLVAYFSRPPAGSVGRGDGVYAVAGSRVRALRPLWSWLAWRRVLFPELGADVPFTVVNAPDADGGLRAVREFRFPGRARRMIDRMHVVETADGPRLHDRLGRRGGLEARLALDVVDGELRMRSDALWLHVGAARIPLPRVAHVSLVERAGGDGVQHVDVRIAAPLLGEVFRYSGAFRYRHVPAARPR